MNASKWLNKNRIPVSLFLLSFAFLVAWSFAIPMFETPDEVVHWQVAEYIHSHHALPFYDRDVIEANQPPLYYLLIAPLASPTVQPNRENGMFSMVLPCFPRIWQICPKDLKRFWPMRFARLLTALVSALGVVFVYLTALEITADVSSAVLAALLITFLPGFAFRAPVVSNDAMVTAASAAATFYIVRLYLKGFQWKDASLAAFAVGIAVMSKLNGIIFFAPLVAVLLLLPGPLVSRLKRLAVLAIPIALMLPWVIRNWKLYGDLLASKQMLVAVPQLIDIKPLTSPYFQHGFVVTLFRTGVGVFGAILTIFMPEGFYTGYGIVLGVGFCVAVYCALRKSVNAVSVALLVSICALAFASVVQLNLTISQPQGRYFYAALPALIILTAIGWGQFLRKRSALIAAASLLYCSAAVYVLADVEIPAYHFHGGPITEWSDVDFPIKPSDIAAVGPLADRSTFGQTFVSAHNNLDVVQVTIATYTHKISQGSLILHLRRDPASTEDIAVVKIPATQLEDNAVQSFKFKPIPDSKDKEFYTFLEQQGIPPATPITVYRTGTDVYPGGQFYLNGKPINGDMLMKTEYSLTPPYSCTVCN